jgi:uncharacterized membrane protein YraQ (UPF0718 family)
MTELIIKMVSSLLGALVIGLIFGYFISRLLFKENFKKEIKNLKYKLIKRNSENIILQDQITHLKSEYNLNLRNSNIKNIQIDNIQPLESLAKK